MLLPFANGGAELVGRAPQRVGRVGVRVDAPAQASLARLARAGTEWQAGRADRIDGRRSPATPGQTVSSVLMAVRSSIAR